MRGERWAVADGIICKAFGGINRLRMGGLGQAVQGIVVKSVRPIEIARAGPVPHGVAEGARPAGRVAASKCKIKAWPPPWPSRRVVMPEETVVHARGGFRRCEYPRR